MPIFLVVLLGVVLIVIVVGFISASSVADAPPDPKRMELVLRADMREVFTPLPLEERRMYRLTLTGVYTYTWPGFFGGGSRQADAGYFQDWNDNFSQPYAGVFVDGQPIRKMESWSENRARHQYSVLVEGFGEQRAFVVHAPKGQGGASLRAILVLLPVDTPLASEKKAAQQAAENQAKAAAEAARKAAEDRTRRATARKAREKRTAEEQKQAAEQARRAAEEKRQATEWKRREKQARAEALAREKVAKESAKTRLQERVDDLKLGVHQNRNVFDRDYRLHLVENYQDEILTEWREEWTQAYNELFNDRQLLAALRKQAPEVLEWHEHRIDVILLAERLAIVPPDRSALLKERRLTSRTMAQVQRAIGELFRLREQIDSAAEQDAVDGPKSARRRAVARAVRNMAFHLDLLKAYGIAAETPEQAEDKFFELCPYQPALASYEQMMERIKAGEAVSTDAIKARLEDLFREEIILQAKRRRFIRIGRVGAREAMDERLAVVRREATFLRDFLKSINVSTEFPDYRQQEESREEQFFKLMRQKTNMTETAKQQGHPEYEEYIDSHIAQEVARLFETNDENYT